MGQGSFFINQWSSSITCLQVHLKCEQSPNLLQNNASYYLPAGKNPRAGPTEARTCHLYNFLPSLYGSPSSCEVSEDHQDSWLVAFHTPAPILSMLSLRRRCPGDLTQTWLSQAEGQQATGLQSIIFPCELQQEVNSNLVHKLLKIPGQVWDGGLGKA